MALTESSTIKEITVLPLEENIQVLVQNDILKDDVIVSSNLHYTLYSADKKDQFLAAIPNGQPYVDAVGW